jgi:probable F420-dependent oxidoreductase
MSQESLLFGLNLPTSAAAGSDPVADARRAEELGFDFVSASDHPCGANPTYETWTMLSWVAASTTRIRIATRVLGVPYRNPALVAKMAETLDRLSGGRLILGLGGGSSDHEFRAFGIPVPGPRDKIDGLGEAVEIIRGLWTQPGFTYEGRLHHTEQADIEPKPAHRIPIWLGTFGERSLALTGRLADGWIPSLGYAPPEQIPAMRDRVLAAARGAGRSPEDITCAYNIEVRIGEDVEEEEHVVSGRPGEVAARLNDFRKMGFSAMNFMLSGSDTTEQAERLALEVIPELRAMA